MSKTSSIGTKLYYDFRSYRDSMMVLCVTSIQGVKHTRPVIDVSALDTDGWREKVVGMLDFDTFQVSGYYYENSQYELCKSKRNCYYVLKIPQVFVVDGEKKNGYYCVKFKGIITEYSTSFELDSAVKFDMAITITSIPTTSIEYTT